MWKRTKEKFLATIFFPSIQVDLSMDPIDFLFFAIFISIVLVLIFLEFIQEKAEIYTFLFQFWCDGMKKYTTRIFSQFPTICVLHKKLNIELSKHATILSSHNLSNKSHWNQFFKKHVLRYQTNQTTRLNYIFYFYHISSNFILFLYFWSTQTHHLINAISNFPWNEQTFLE